MLIFGLALIGVAALLILAAAFTAEVSDGRLELIGLGVPPLALFLLGVFAGVCVLVGLSISKSGAQRAANQRKENKRQTKLSKKSDKKAERRKDHDEGL